MDKKTVIRFSNVSKEYHLYKSSKQRLIGTLTGHKKGKKKGTPLCLSTLKTDEKYSGKIL